jgi:hypothetical protein
MNFDVEKCRIFEAITGSRLYGLANEFSDTDYRGVCLPPLEVLLNPFESFDQKDSGFEEADRVIYSLPKFMKLCADGNPNIIELLFIPKQNIVYKSRIWDKILRNKQYFISKKVKHTFTGYAFAQLKRIERHRQWLLNPVSKLPDRSEFGLPEMPEFGFEKLQNVLHAPKETIRDEYREYASKEMAYRDKKEDYDQYQSWFKTRNPDRFILEQKFGYDTKHASHLFRLMTEGKELLLTGNITFPLPNAEEILAIKNGSYSYGAMIEVAKSMEKDFETWYEMSTLPFSSDKKALTDLYFDVILSED